MAEAIAERVRRYALEGDDEDLRRLLRISELTPDALRMARFYTGCWSASACRPARSRISRTWPAIPP